MTASRHQQILALLSQKRSLSLTELKISFQVTPMTLWRDLKALEEQGLLKRVHGGAILPLTQIPEPSFESRLIVADPVKQGLV